MNKNLNKYNNLNQEYFSTGINYRYEWKYNGKDYALDWDFAKDEGYLFYDPDKKETNQWFKDIYHALDSIKFDGKTLRELLIKTDFDFTFIY